MTSASTPASSTSLVSPLLHLPLRGTVEDLSGRGNDPAPSKISMIDDPDLGPCASFGNGSKISLPALACPAAFTMMVWVKRDPDAPSAGIRTLIEFGDNQPILGLLHGTNPYFYASRRGDKPTATTALLGPDIPAAWTHVAVTVDPQSTSLYIDGERVASSHAADATGVGLGIGFNRGNAHFNGRLVDARIYDEALTAEAIRACMTAIRPAAPVEAAAFAAPVEPAPSAAAPTAGPLSFSDDPAPPAVYVHNVVIPEFTDWSKPAEEFYKTHGDDYDFLIYVSEQIPGLNPCYRPIRRELCPGLGYVQGRGIAPVRNGATYGSAERLKGVIWLPLDMRPGWSPPTSNHEILHYWGTHLLSRWPGLITDMKGHWGFASTNGSHGGFDITSLRDAADQPILDPLTVQPGTVVRVSYFNHAASTIATPYSPIELLLMGLVDRSEVPQDIYVMKNPSSVRTDPAPPYAYPYGETVVPRTSVYKVDGFTRVTLDELLADNAGGPPAATQKAFRAAWVLVTAEAATDAMMAKVEWYAKLSGHVIEDRPPTHAERMAEYEAKQRAAGKWIEGMSPNPAAFPPRARYLSFEEATGGRATLDTRLTPKTTT